MYGGARDKRAKLLTSSRWLADAMCLLCDKSHKHSSWGACFRDRWGTSSAAECEYPETMCTIAADAFDEDLSHLADAYTAAQKVKDKSKGGEHHVSLGQDAASPW
eukprot:4717276-Pyramimonas_sp.AAC.1